MARILVGLVEVVVTEFFLEGFFCLGDAVAHVLKVVIVAHAISKSVYLLLRLTGVVERLLDALLDRFKVRVPLFPLNSKEKK